MGIVVKQVLHHFALWPPFKEYNRSMEMLFCFEQGARLQKGLQNVQYPVFANQVEYGFKQRKTKCNYKSYILMQTYSNITVAM